MLKEDKDESSAGQVVQPPQDQLPSQAVLPSYGEMRRRSRSGSLLQNEAEISADTKTDAKGLLIKRTKKV
tara:strand:- start:19471 stop:19680 length:210 start_codon:yes stop_codon:yes gene_type:complete